MNNVLITGATGLVGDRLLRLLVQEPSISRIAAPTRRSLGMRSEKIFNPVDPQLTDALALVEGPIDTVFCCLGTTRREAGSKEAFIHADYALVVDTALAGRRLGATHLLVVSAMGANAHSLFFYNRVKGQMEETLAAQNWPHLTIARPSMLTGEREKKRTSESLLAPLFALLPGNLRNIDARDVALALLHEARQPSAAGVNIIPSAKLRETAAGAE